MREREDALQVGQELTEENKELKVQMDEFSNRAWQSSSAVRECTACTKAFTVNRRKHHCRNCG